MGMGTAIAGGLYQSISGANEMNDAKDALANYHRQQLQNVTEGLSPSMYGADLARQEQGRLASEQVAGLQGAGVRGLVGGLGRVQAGNENVMAQTGANLDQQQHNIEQMRAEDDVRIRNMRNDIENRDIAGLSSQVQAGKQDMYGGFGNIIQGAGMLGGGGAGANTGGASKYSTSGYGTDMTNPNFQSPTTMRNAPEAGFSNNFNFSTYQQPTYGPQQPYGVFNRFPYSQPYGPINQ